MAIEKILSDQFRVQGVQLSEGDADYDMARRQYAFDSYKDDTKERLNPGLIVRPKNIEDIKATVRYANFKKLAIAIKSGGHQYCAASSTGPNNIQLDLHGTFRAAEDFAVLESSREKDADVRVSVSWSLGELLDKLSGVGLFVPTGQCTSVHVGGHLHTGGYGQLARSFGLFGDHVQAVEMIDNKGELKKLDKTNQPELLAAILGGSPGNFGVVTHVKLLAHKDSAYNGSIALKAIHPYNADTLESFLGILAKMADDDNVPANFDLCISVLSPKSKIVQHLSGDNKQVPPQLLDKDGRTKATILAYAQWVKLKPTDTLTPQIDEWFTTLAKGGFSPFDPSSKAERTLGKQMSEIVKFWIFRSNREFDHPYVKRTFISNSKTLTKDGWPKWMAKHLTDKTEPDNGLYVSAQLQVYGGKNAKFVQNAGKGTSYTWRTDATLGCAIDCFHEDDPAHKKDAEDWEKITDTMIGKTGCFAKEERRLLWGSFGEWKMSDPKIWQTYYDADTYQKIRKIRKQADPTGVFAANPFCVPIAD